MNRPQRILLAIGACLIAAMTLFPPWVLIYNPNEDVLDVQKATRPFGYHFVFSQSVPEDRTELARIFGLNTNTKQVEMSFFSTAIDTQRIILQIVGVVIVSMLLVLLFRTRSKDA